jgi:PAS domain S-box-containing protein
MIALVCGFFVTVLAYGLAQQWDVMRRTSQFREDVNFYGQAIQRQLSLMQADVQSLAQFYNASQQVTYQEFVLFTQPFLANRLGLQAFAWLPKVTAAQRPAFEQTHTLTIQSPENTPLSLDSMAIDAVYYPFSWMTPHANDSLLGVDFWSQPDYRTAMQQALATRQTVAIPARTAVNMPEQGCDFFILATYTQNQALNEQLAAKKHNIKGFVAGLVCLKQLIEGVLQDFEPHGIDFILRQPGTARTHGILFAHASRLRTANDPPLDPASRTAGFYYQIILELAGYQLILDASPMPGRYAATQWPLLTFIFGLLITGIITALLWFQHSMQISLREREQLFLLFIDQGPMIAWIKDRQHRYVYLSTSYRRHFQLRDHERLSKTPNEIYPQHISKPLIAADQHVFDSNQPLEVEETIPDPDGSLRRWKCLKIPFHNHQGHRFLGGIAIDVQAQHDAERALLDQQTLFSIVLRHSPLALDIREVTPEGSRIMQASDTYAQLIGRLQGEAVNGHWLHDLIPQALAKTEHQDDLALVTKMVCKTEMRHLYERDYLCIRVPIARQPHSLIASYRLDMTKQRAAEQHLHYYQQIVEYSSEMLLFVDRDFRYQIVNPPYAAFYGYVPEQLTNRLIREVVSAELYAKVLPRLQAALSGQEQQFTSQSVDYQGQKHILEVHYQPLHRNESIEGVIVSIHDITEAATAQAALQQQQVHLEQVVATRTAELAASHDHIRLILDSSADGLYGIDLNGRVTFINKSACNLLGYKAEQLLGQTIHDIIHNRYTDGTPYPIHACPTCKAITENQVFRIENEVFWHADGRAIPVTYAGHPMLANGQVVGAVVSFMDISDRIAAEQSLAKALQEAEQLAAAKAAFLANMSHEIRTPMTAIMGLAELVAHKRHLPKDVRTDIEQIHRSAQALLGILNDILDYSKLEAGRFTIDHIAFAPQRILDTVKQLFMTQIHKKGLTFILQSDPDVPIVVLGDSLRLQQILANLISNAIKFTQRGHITVSLQVAQWISEEQVRLRWSVQDTGTGIESDTLERLFQPFTQADNSISRNFGGTGLGLTISQQLLQLMGGEFDVSSQPGQGSCFTFELTFTRVDDALLEMPASNEVTHTPANYPSLSTAKILVAEDNVINQHVIRGMLALFGVHATIVNHGQEVLDYLAHNDCDVILMDVHMPELDGLETTKRLRADDQWCTLPIIALTAGVTMEEREQIIAVGMNDLLAKPIDSAALSQCLIKWLAPAESGELDDQTDTHPAPDQLPLHSEASSDLSVTPALPIIDFNKPFTLPGFNLDNLFLIMDDGYQVVDLLQQFSEGAQKDMMQLEQALTNADYGEAHRLSHRLKGVTGNVGAMMLHEPLQVLDQELRAGHAPRDQSVVDVYDAYRDMMALIEHVAQQVAATDKQPPPTTDSPSLSALFVEIQQRLTRMEWIPSELLDTIQSLLAPQHHALYQEFRRHVKNIDYTLATERLVQLQQQLDRDSEVNVQ